MRPSSRRDFLKLTAASLALLAGGPVSRFFAADAAAAEINKHLREYIILCDTDQDFPQPKDVHIRVSHPGSVRGLDVASGEVFSIDLPFFGHTVNQHPLHPEQVVTFEKWGHRGALLDLKDRKVLMDINPAEDNTFFGHAAFNADGGIMAVTENNYDATQGLLTFRDTSDYKTIQKYSSYGLLPHECRTPDHGKTIMVVNKGGDNSPPNLSWIDWNSGRLLNKVEFPADNNVLYGHCDLSHDNWVCASGLATSHSKDMVLFVSPDGRVLPPALPEDITRKMKGEALSIAFLGRSGLVAVTVTLANLVLLIDYKTQRLVEAVPIANPHGVLPSRYPDDTEISMLVTSYEKRNLSSITLESGKPDIKTVSSEFGGLGSHLTRLYL